MAYKTDRQNKRRKKLTTDIMQRCTLQLRPTRVNSSVVYNIIISTIPRRLKFQTPVD